MDPYDKWPPLLFGPMAPNRRAALRALLGAGVFPLSSAIGCEGTAADLRKDPLANDRLHSWGRPSAQPVAPSVLPAMRVFTDAAGRTQFERLEIPLTGEQTPGLLIQRAETFAIRVMPPGTVFDWHMPSRRRLVYVMRGKAGITLRDGRSTTATTGSLVLVENINSDGHQGWFDTADYTLTLDVGFPLGSGPPPLPNARTVPG